MNSPRRWYLLAMMLAAIVAFAPALKAPFQFDDVASITDNRSIQSLSPLSVVLSPPSGSTAVSGRPIVNVSLALNYAVNAWIGIDQNPETVGQARTVGYHLANLLFHLACGLLLFGILRRTLLLAKFADRWAGSADGVSAVVTAFWLLHPIQTEAVDYVIHRTELIVSLCYLGTLYASIRAWSAASLRQKVSWYVVAFCACLLGMGSKEVMISAPLAVMLYDRAFRASSWRQLVSPRGGRLWFYVALFATTAWTIALVTAGPRAGTVGFGLDVSVGQYLYSQAWAIAHYVRLLFWPYPLIIDYGQDPISGLRGVPGLILLSALGVATIVAWARVEKWGWFAFTGTWFFMLLAPSSSFVPINTAIAAERRFYLASISVILLVVLGVETLRRRVSRAPETQAIHWSSIAMYSTAVLILVAALEFPVIIRGNGEPAEGFAALVGLWSSRVTVACFAGLFSGFLMRSTNPRWAVFTVAAVLAGTTFQHSRHYDRPEYLWAHVVDRFPDSPRSLNGLGYAALLKDTTNIEEAERLVQEATMLDSTYLPAWRTLAAIAVKRRDLEGEKWILERELQIDPHDAKAAERLGKVLDAMMPKADRRP